MWLWVSQIAAAACAVAPPATVITSDAQAMTALVLELAIAVAVDGRTLEIRRQIERMVEEQVVDDAPTYRSRTAETPSSRIRLRPLIETHSTPLDVTTVAAQRIDGRNLSYKVLIQELKIPTPVVFLREGQQLDSIFSQMFKPETIVLQLRPPKRPALMPVPENAKPSARMPGSVSQKSPKKKQDQPLPPKGSTR